MESKWLFILLAAVGGHHFQRIWEKHLILADSPTDFRPYIQMGAKASQ
jgi:hypothetical protein